MKQIFIFMITALFLSACETTPTPPDSQPPGIVPPQPIIIPQPPKPLSDIFRDRLQNGGEGPEMVMIPAGSFRMGDIQGGGSSDEKPVHRVSVKRFAMGLYEVTVGEFRKFVNATGYKTDAEKGDGCYAPSLDMGFFIKEKYSNWRKPNFSQSDNHPVVCVSWNDATAYAQWLSQQTGKQYRLPTEAEWEYAARARTQTKYWWGNSVGNNRAVCDGCGSKWDNKSTAPVGSFQANTFGLYDTVGNVLEWTCSEYIDKYNGKEKVCLSKNSNKTRVLRGGSWVIAPGYLRTAIRNGLTSDDRVCNYGFRVVRAAWTN